MPWKINWDNGNDACGTFSYSFGTEQEATDYGNDWVTEMTALTPELTKEDIENGLGYSFDVFEDTDVGQNRENEEEGLGPEFWC